MLFTKCINRDLFLPVPFFLLKPVVNQYLRHPWVTTGFNHLGGGKR